MNSAVNIVEYIVVTVFLIMVDRMGVFLPCNA